MVIRLIMRGRMRNEDAEDKEDGDDGEDEDGGIRKMTMLERMRMQRMKMGTMLRRMKMRTMSKMLQAIKLPLPG